MLRRGSCPGGDCAAGRAESWLPRRGILRLRGDSSARTRTRGEKSRLFAQNDGSWLWGDRERCRRWRHEGLRNDRHSDGQTGTTYLAPLPARVMCRGRRAKERRRPKGLRYIKPNSRDSSVCDGVRTVDTGGHARRERIGRTARAVKQESSLCKRTRDFAHPIAYQRRRMA
jgi:hypothetical protein